MAYVQTEWVAGVTPLSEANMDHLETQYDEILALLTTRGDIFYKPAGTATRLPLGASGYVLKSDGTDIAWAAPALIVTGTYAGNDTDNRQITTGMVCTLVIIQDLAALEYQWTIISTANSMQHMDDSPYHNVAADALLHATDGFNVDQVEANNTGTTYTYWAIGDQ